MNISVDNLWTEKYRPQALKDVLLTKEQREYFDSVYLKQEIPHLLFCGSPGTGKTTLARIIVQDILQCQYLYINASDESSVDTIRTKIISFAKTRALDNKHKVVVLDECDGMGTASQRILRGVMEEYAKICRFILTANYKHRIIDAVISRCQIFDIQTPTFDTVKKRVEYILEQEGVQYKNSGDLDRFIKQRMPDMRRIINDIQKNSSGGTLVISDDTTIQPFIEKIWTLLKNNKLIVARKFLIENESVFDNDYPLLLRQVLNHLYTQNIDKAKKSDMVIAIGDYIYKSNFVVDQEINAYACLLHIEKIYSS